MTRIMVVDDDPLACKILLRMLQPQFEVNAFADSEEAFKHFAQNGADVIMTDLKMPKMNGFELLAKAKEVDPEVIVFMITGHSSIESAVTAVKKGAYDYIAKPFDPDDVLHRLNRVLREKSLEEKVFAYQQERQLESDKYVPLTNHPKMLQVLDLAKKVARTESTVLIQGETGVGKELVARMIHQWSPRSENSFVPVNCSALADGVLESELFGHEKGAFTGAVNKRIGYFELADKGTILLDEIGTTENSFQVKLLRVLQDRIVYRVGSTSAISIDTRVIASTNQDLEAEARDELFRSDLYYRLSVVTIRVPPLRERMEDIPLLVQHFIKKYQHVNPQVGDISADGLQLLSSYHYPGNVRELENVIERAMILETGDALTPDSLLVGGSEPRTNPLSPQSDDPADEFRIEEMEKEHILRVLKKCNGKKMEAAKMLGVNKTTLWRKMKRYGMT